MKNEEITSPKFYRDILPYFYYPAMVVISIIAMVYTRNHFLPFWILYLLAPSSNLFGNNDTAEVAASAQKKFMEDCRFNVPLYTTIFVATSTWIWSLVLMSDKYEIEGKWFSQIKP